MRTYHEHTGFADDLQLKIDRGCRQGAAPMAACPAQLAACHVTEAARKAD
jgi:hypothetical protein